MDMPINESELTAGVRIVPGRSYGFFTDTTVCIGCKACEVACKEWNNLPADHIGLTGESYDNTGALSANTWRHVAFIEKSDVRSPQKPPGQGAWLMMSDVCKHCHNAPCMEACPTGALFKTEFDTVVVQQDICNGCGYCVPACPFGVVDLNELDGKAHKCTLCYDRLKGGLEPACSKSCPTDSIQFGELDDLHARARQRVDELKAQGIGSAYLYGVADGPGATGDLGNLSAFFLLTDTPETYNLPRAPTRASRRVAPALVSGLATVAGLALTAALAFGGRGVPDSWGGESYYGRPSLKPAPFNNWVVGGYVFLAGLGGKISLLTGLADLLRPAGSAEMIRRGRYLPLAVPTLGAALLIYDLHTPQRFYNMFRVAKATSPMSIGTWVLSGYSLSTIVTAALEWAGLRRAAAIANAPAAVFGAGMGTYTAALLAATSTPLWAAAPRTLAARFASASFASAAATLSLMEQEGPTRRALDTITAISLASEIVLDGAQALALQRAGIANALAGGWGLVGKLGATGSGAALPLGMLVLSALEGGRGNLPRVASALAIAGAFVLRVATLEAGRRSAIDPAIGFRFAQPDNLPRVRPPRRSAVERRARRLARRSPSPPSG